MFLGESVSVPRVFEDVWNVFFYLYSIIILTTIITRADSTSQKKL